MIQQPSVLIALPVRFGTIRIDDRAAILDVAALLYNMPLEQVRGYLCDRSVTGSIVARPRGSLAEQESLPSLEDSDLTISATFTINGFTVKTDGVKVRLVFPLEAIDVRELARFAKRNGVLTINEEA